MTRLAFAPATAEQAAYLAPRLRQADIDEIKAASGLDAGQALLEAVDLSWTTLAALYDGQPLAIAGCVAHPDDASIGVIWMLASDDMERHPRSVVKGAKAWVAGLLAKHDMLLNFVDNRNHKSQRWLEWLGFHLEDPQPFGPAGMPFRYFWMRAPGDQCVPRQDTINFVSPEVNACVTSPPRLLQPLL